MIYVPVVAAASFALLYVAYLFLLGYTHSESFQHFLGSSFGSEFVVAAVAPDFVVRFALEASAAVVGLAADHFAVVDLVVADLVHHHHYLASTSPRASELKRG